MAKHTTFEVGGPADVYAVPADAQDVATILRFSKEHDLPLFILGGGANILVSDDGFRGIVMDMGDIAEFEVRGEKVRVGAGLPISAAAERAAEAGLGGLDFLYSMPGSTGGALWMNARCYGSSVDDILEAATLVDEEGEIEHYTPKDGDFAYKVSPFQSRRAVIIDAVFKLHRDEVPLIRERMNTNEEDRRSKGHFDAPSAGSVFKNNRAFGNPSGVIIDGLGLRGTQIGGARVSDGHANIFINAQSATATDMRRLIEYVARRVLDERGFALEQEVLYVGDWSRWSEGANG